MRALTQSETRAHVQLLQYVQETALLLPTRTALEKAIIDATLPVRTLLKVHGIHDYAAQGQGSENKVVIPARLLTDERETITQISLYRPVTKKGDPRIWIQSLPQYADADDVLALFAVDRVIYLLNLSSTRLGQLTAPEFLVARLAAAHGSKERIATELLEKLRTIALGGPIPAECLGDTAVGRTLETALGIAMNSSRKPDYYGIELKSYRAARKNRINLFAKVPNWTLSPFKSSAAILDGFGYPRSGTFKLYCEVSTMYANSQGLRLRVQASPDWLVEWAKGVGDVAVWEMDTLHQCLLEKHRETFWIRAETSHLDGREHFHFTQVKHTQSPSVVVFDQLLLNGIVTLDHLIKRDGSQVQERGPLFKIEKDGLEELFPNPRVYNLCSR